MVMRCHPLDLMAGLTGGGFTGGCAAEGAGEGGGGRFDG
jgi:hypothetical protein